MHKDSNYSLLLSSFDQLYKDLTTINAANFQTVEKVFTFTSEEIFKQSLPTKVLLLESMSQTLKMYQSEIEKIIRLVIGMFAEAFAYQKGSIFGFGPNTNDNTKNVMKILQASPEILKKLDQHVMFKTLVRNRTLAVLTMLVL